MTTEKRAEFDAAVGAIMPTAAELEMPNAPEPSAAEQRAAILYRLEKIYDKLDRLLIVVENVAALAYRRGSR